MTTTHRVMIGGSAPRNDLPRFQRGVGIDDARMDQILRLHEIEPSLRPVDHFEAFFQQRETALLSRIERAMGKPIVREDVVPRAEISLNMTDTYQEEEDDAS